MILYIDTTDNSSAELALLGRGADIRERFLNLPHAENFTIQIRKFLQKNKIKLADLQKIAVNTGPGFFSRIRTGVVAANTLGFALAIPIVPVKKPFTLKQIQNAKGVAQAKPVYTAPPNITKPKKRL